MALLPTTALTLADMKAAMGPDGHLAGAIDMLSQCNEVLDDLLWVPANDGMTNLTTVKVGLPAAFWRAFNEGVPPSKSVSAQHKDACAMLEVYSKVDKDLADLTGEPAAWRLSEDQSFVEGMSQQMARTLFYGNAGVTPKSFTGLSARYPTVNTSVAANASNVLDAGGTGSTNTSMWVCNWGPNSGHGIYPKGSMGGLQVNDVTTNAPILDAVGNSYQAYQTHYKWDCGLTIRDWRYFARIANIDVTQLTGVNAANLIALLVTAINKLPAVSRRIGAVQGATKASGIGPVPMNPVIYVNRTIRTALELQLLSKSNILLKMEEYDGMTVLTFRGIPIRTVDVLLNTESRVV